MTSAASQKAAANRRAHLVFQAIEEIGPSRPLREIAAELDRRGVPTDRGGRWHAASVARVLRRVGLPVGVEVAAGTTRLLAPRSVSAVVTSPPYANQRKRLYGGISEADYPDWTVEWMAKVRPALAENGNVAIVIRPHVRDGQISDYVLRTRLAVREAGWYEIDELIWVKPSAPPVGRPDRPRRSWESILWFSPSPNPFCDPAANGRPSRRVGFSAKKHRDILFHGTAPHVEGVARCKDYVEVSASAVHRENYNTHPAQYPVELAAWLVRLLCPAGGVVVDPFLGSGTTAVAAASTGRRFIGSDISDDYIKIARRRLQSSVEAKARRTA